MIFDLLFAAALYIRIGYAIWEKQMKVTSITTGGVTKVRSIVLTEKGLIIALIGLGIVAILFTYLGFVALLSEPLDLESKFFWYLFIGFIWFITFWIAEYFNASSD